MVDVVSWVLGLFQQEDVVQTRRCAASCFEMNFIATDSWMQMRPVDSLQGGQLPPTD